MTGPRIPRLAQHGGWWSRSNVAANDPAQQAAPAEPEFVDSQAPDDLPHTCAQCGANTGTADPALMTLLAGATRVGEHIQQQRQQRLGRQLFWDGVWTGLLAAMLGTLCLVAVGRALADWLY